jgi:hypothetical protein
MNDHPDLFPFPAISDEAVIAVNHFLEEFYTRFQNHYFAQLHRYYADLHDPARCNGQMSLPLDDPPY